MIQIFKQGIRVRGRTREEREDLVTSTDCTINTTVVDLARPRVRKVRPTMSRGFIRRPVSVCCSLLSVGT